MWLGSRQLTADTDGCKFAMFDGHLCWFPRLAVAPWSDTRFLLRFGCQSDDDISQTFIATRNGHHRSAGDCRNRVGGLSVCSGVALEGKADEEGSLGQHT